MTKTFELGIYGIKVVITDKFIGQVKTEIGEISSELKNRDVDDDVDNYDEFEAAVDGIESLILAHALAGIDIESEAYKEGIESSITKIANNFL